MLSCKHAQYSLREVGLDQNFLAEVSCSSIIPELARKGLFSLKDLLQGAMIKPMSILKMQINIILLYFRHDRRASSCPKRL